MKPLLGMAAAVLLAGLAYMPAQAATLVFDNAFGNVYQAPPGNVNGITGVTEHDIFMDADGTADQDHIGHVDSQNGLPLVQFHTDANLTTANGFAQIGNGSSDIFHSLSVAVAGFFIHDLLFDTNGAINGPNNNDVTITGFLNNVALTTFAGTGFGTGSVSWLILADVGKNFDEIVISSLSGFTKIDHIKVSGSGNDLTPTPNVVPLPAGIWLFGTALAGMGALRMRRRRRA